MNCERNLHVQWLDIVWRYQPSCYCWRTNHNSWELDLISLTLLPPSAPLPMIIIQNNKHVSRKINKSFFSRNLFFCGHWQRLHRRKLQKRGSVSTLDGLDRPFCGLPAIKNVWHGTERRVRQWWLLSSHQNKKNISMQNWTAIYFNRCQQHQHSADSTKKHNGLYR